MSVSTPPSSPDRWRPARWAAWPLWGQCLSILLPLAALLGLGLFLDYQREVDRERERTRLQLETVAQLGAQALVSTVRVADLTVRELREAWRRDPAGFRQAVALRESEAEQGYGFQVATIDAQGILTFSSADPQAKPVDLSDRAHFRVHREQPDEDRLYVSQPVWGRVVKRWTIQFTRPLRDERNRFAGVLVFSVSPDYLSRLFDPRRLGPEASLTIFREDGAVILRTQPTPPAGASPNERPPDGSARIDSPRATLRTLAAMGLPPDGHGRWRSSIDGVDRFYAWRSAPGYPLTLSVSVPAASLDAAMGNLRTRYLAGGVVAVVLLALAIHWLLLTQRTRALAARRLAEQVELLQRSQAQLRASQQALRDHSSQRVARQEADDKRVAQQLHEELGQRLTVLRMDVSTLETAVRPEPAALLPARVRALKAAIDDILAIVRDVSGRLRPATLDIGLPAAASALCEEFQASLAIPCPLDNRLPPELVLDEATVTGAFRILQESITNAGRHAQAQAIRVALQLDGPRLCLSVQDDGRGFDPETIRESGLDYGLAGMRERAAALGGELRIISTPGSGTTVEARLPLRQVANPVSVQAPAESITVTS